MRRPVHDTVSRTASKTGSRFRSSMATSDFTEQGSTTDFEVEIQDDINTQLSKSVLRRITSLGQEPTTGVQVICVGVMRTGLKTLHQALMNLGYSNIYDQEDIVDTYENWDKILWNKGDTMATMKNMFSRCEVIMGMPTFCFWEQIVELHPNARIILTVRDEDDWWHSVQHAEDHMRKDLPAAPLRYGSAMRCLEKYLMPSYHKYCEVLRFAWASTLGAHALADSYLNEKVVRSSFRKHNTFVKAALGEQMTASGNPRLLIYNVKDGWEPLCQFLRKDIPQVDFPSVLQVPYFPGAPIADGGGGSSFEDMILPDSKFGVRMRQELRAGLLKSAFALTSVLAVMLTILTMWSDQVPVMFAVCAYVVIMGSAWNVYLVVNNLVLKVPALVILPMATKSLLIAGALQITFITYGILKEMLVTRDRIASPVLVLSSRLGAIICAGAFMLVTEGRVTISAPLGSMAAFSLTNEASTWAGYEMLKYVSFPVQVMAKSVKMLPTMIIGKIVNGTVYSTMQYVQAVIALGCVGVMSFSDEASASAASHPGQPANDDNLDRWHRICMGILLVTVFFVCDSFTPQWQTKLYKQHPGLTKTQMMLGGNLLGFLMTLVSLFASWGKVHESFVNALENPMIMCRILLLGMVYALGQFCIYSAIRIIGPLSFTWIMTARQLLSVLISLVFFGHGVNMLKVVCILTVFGIMSVKHLAKAVPIFTEGAHQFTQVVSRTVRSRKSESVTGLKKKTA